MKKVLIVFIALLASVSIFAQDMESATNMYNEGATALNLGDKETALKCFQEALSQAEMIGAEAEELMYNCKKNIPVLIMSIGKEKVTTMTSQALSHHSNKLLKKLKSMAKAML